MTINQLFKNEPPIILINNILTSFGVNGVSDKREFNKFTITDESIKNMQPFLDELRDFYINSKRDTYFNNLTSKKVITIIKQVVKPHKFKLVSKEKFLKEYNKKITTYTLQSLNPKRPNLSLSFD